MSSEHLASAQNELKGNLGGAWNILDGAQGQYQDLGIARRFGGSSAAYSLRDIGAMNGKVVRVRREPHDTSAGIDDEINFSANQISSGALEDWVNGKLETTLPADVDTAAAAYSLRKVNSSYSGDAVRIRRSSDDIEVDVAFDSEGKVSASSAITNVAEEGGESGSTSATDLNGFLNANEQTVGSSQNGTGSVAYNSFSGDSNTGFTVTNSDAGTFKQAVFGYESGEGDVIVANFDLNITSGTPTIQVRTGAAIGTLTSKSNDATVSSSANHTVTLTCTGDGLYIKFLESDACTFSVSNFTIVSHTQGATVHTWYDQAGANNAVQETAANQPKIAEGGALITKRGQPSLKFRGTDSTPIYLDSPANITANFSFFIAAQPAADGTTSGSSSGEKRNHTLWSQGSTFHMAGINSDFTNGFRHGNTILSYGAGLDFNTNLNLHSLTNGSSNVDYFGNAVNKINSTNSTTTAASYDIGRKVNITSHNTRGYISEFIHYNSDQSNNRFKIESNINNYYGLYNDANDFSGNPTAELTPSAITLTNESKTGFTAEIDATSGTKQINFPLLNSLVSGDDYFVSFDYTSTSTSTVGVKPRTAALGSASNDVISATNSGFYGGTGDAGHNGFDINNTATVLSFQTTAQSFTFTVSNLKVSRIARNGFVETWYDQSGNGRDMIQATAGNQPSIVSNGGYMGGVYSAPASNSTTNSNKQYMRITGTNSFASNDFTTTKVGMVAIVNSLESGTASGVSIYAVMGNIRGVQSFPTGAIGLQISGTNNSQFTNYTATNAENKDQSISTRTVGENTLIGGTMDNRNIKTFTFTEQGSDTDNTTASTDIVLTSQKDFGIFYSTFATDSGGEDLNVTRTAGGYMKEAYILDGDIIDDIDAINLELRQHYNLA